MPPISSFDASRFACRIPTPKIFFTHLLTNANHYCNRPGMSTSDPLKIVFLDLDGVVRLGDENGLNPRFSKLCMNRVIRLCAATDAKIVVLSDLVTLDEWNRSDLLSRIHDDCGVEVRAEFDLLLFDPWNPAKLTTIRDKPGIAKRFLDVHHARCVILDDVARPYAGSSLQDRVIQPNNRYGLQESHVAEAIRLLCPTKVPAASTPTRAPAVGSLGLEEGPVDGPTPEHLRVEVTPRFQPETMSRPAISSVTWVGGLPYWGSVEIKAGGLVKWELRKIKHSGTIVEIFPGAPVCLAFDDERDETFRMPFRSITAYEPSPKMEPFGDCAGKTREPLPKEWEDFGDIPIGDFRERLGGFFFGRDRQPAPDRLPFAEEVSTPEGLAAWSLPPYLVDNLPTFPRYDGTVCFMRHQKPESYEPGSIVDCGFIGIFCVTDPTPYTIPQDETGQHLIVMKGYSIAHVKGEKRVVNYIPVHQIIQHTPVMPSKEQPGIKRGAAVKLRDGRPGKLIAWNKDACVVEVGLHERQSGSNRQTFSWDDVILQPRPERLDIHGAIQRLATMLGMSIDPAFELFEDRPVEVIDRATARIKELLERGNAQ